MAADPTRTLTLRRRFEGEVYRRFRKLKGLINRALTEHEALGPKNEPVTNREAQKGEFLFDRDAEKINAFMNWLRGEVQRGILEIDIDDAARLGAIESAWMGIYVRQAYQQGVKRGIIELKRAGLVMPAGASEAQQIQMRMATRVHADRIGVVFTRAYTQLKGITDVMDQQISRVLADGMAAGDSPAEIARAINNRVDKIGITRARVLARTEVINAHHKANVQTYKEFGVEGVKVEAEFMTARDNKVCELCGPLHGKIYTIKKVENLIPVHPNCRCFAAPHLPDIGGI